jgi:hypothetical protein
MLRAFTPGTDLSLTFAGWLMLLFLAATVLIIVYSAVPPLSPPLSCLYMLRGYLFLTIGLAVAIFCVGIFSHMMTAREAWAVDMVLAAWLALWCGLSTLLRRVSPAFSVASSMALAMFFFAGPVSTLPLLRAAPANSAAQRLLIQCVSTLTPMLAVLDAIKGSLPLSWAQLPQMYHLTTAGQDFPMPLPLWWISALLYTALALASLLLATVFKARRAK